MKKYKSLAITLTAAMLLGSCSDAPKPAAQAPLPAVQKTTVSSPSTSATITSAPSITTVAATTPVYAYNPQGRRDPFTPLIIREEKKALVGARTPLERYAIHEFKLAGIVWGGLGYHAMLEGPDGKGYFVKTGTIMGPNRGVVKKITQNAMHVEEQYRDPSGQMKKKEIVIELRKKQEGMP